jgi:PBP1b-binding outer membrane lipoprotein LpoB
MKYLLITILLLASCSTEKRCANHLRKAKELGCLTMDTVTKYDTIVGFSVDTIFIADSFTSVDTFILIKDNVKTKTVINWKDRIVYQSVLKDTTIVETKYSTITITEYKHKTPRWAYFLMGFLALIVLGLVFGKK